MKGLVVCVDYDDHLSQTLRANARHLTEIVVVTSPADKRTPAVVKTVPSARCYVTDAFYRNGAHFNKGAALEEAFDALGRDGWILLWDADILLPDKLILDDLDPQRLYGAKRRMAADGKLPAGDWRGLPVSQEAGWPGFFQLFHGSAAVLAKTRPWYGVHSPHAGIGDAYFQNQWPTTLKGWLPFEVLHLGPRDVNWFGRVEPRSDGGAVRMTPEQADRCFDAAGWQRPKTR